MKKGVSLLLTLALLFPVIASCTPATGSPNSGIPRETPSGAAPGGGNPPAKVPAGAEEPVKLAAQDLTQRTRVPTDQIQVQTVEEVEWRDSSLGCPEPGKMYAQVITPGYRILLVVQGKTYEYHSDRGRTVVLCEKPA